MKTSYINQSVFSSFYPNNKIQSAKSSFAPEIAKQSNKELKGKYSNGLVIGFAIALLAGVYKFFNRKRIDVYLQKDLKRFGSDLDKKLIDKLSRPFSKFYNPDFCKSLNVKEDELRKRITNINLIKTIAQEFELLKSKHGSKLKKRETKILQAVIDRYSLYLRDFKAIPYEKNKQFLVKNRDKISYSISDEKVRRARAGDKVAIEKLEKRIVRVSHSFNKKLKFNPWDNTTLYRFISKREVDAVLSGKHIFRDNGNDLNPGDFSENLIDTTLNPKYNFNKYRVTFKRKDKFDPMIDGEEYLPRTVVKNEEMGQCWTYGGYSLNDVEKIELMDQSEIIPIKQIYPKDL